MISIESGETKTAVLKFGKRQISVNDQPAQEIYLDKDNDYLLNPSKETYYIEKTKYFASQREEKRYYEDHYPEKSTVEGFELNGEYKKIENQILIKKVWKFGLEKEKTSSVYTKIHPSKGYIVVSKIHRRKDLSDFISNELSNQLDAYIKEKELTNSN